MRATVPLTRTRPSAISSSARRRDATPARAMIFWSRSLTIGGLSQGRQLSGVARQRREILDRGQAEALEEGEARAEEHGAARSVAASDLDDEPPMHQGPNHVVRVDAADALDVPARARLAVCDDGKGLERRRREPRFLARCVRS